MDKLIEELTYFAYDGERDFFDITRSEAKSFLNELGKKDDEIERLNNIRNKAIDFLKKNACIDEDVRYFCDDLRYDDCNILLDILEGDGSNE